MVRSRGASEGQNPVKRRGLFIAPGVPVGVLSSLLSVSVLAQTTTGQGVETSVQQLESVVVTAKKLEEQIPNILETQGIKVETVTYDQIFKGGYVDIAQSLQMLAPGLYISPKNGPFDYVDVSLLGSRTEDVLWLLDGVRMNNRLYAGTTPLDTLPSSIVDSIQILEGGQGLFYGTEAAAGAIDILTKNFSLTPDGAVTIGGDTNRSFHFDGYFRNSLAQNHFVVYGDVDTSDGYQPFRDQDIQPSDTAGERNYHVYTFGTKYAYDFSHNLRASAFFQHSSATLDFGQPYLTAVAHNERNENILTGKLDYANGDAFQFFLKGYYHWWASHYTEFDNVIGSPGETTPVEDGGFWGYDDRGLNLMARFRLNSALYGIVGYDFQNYEGHDAVLVIEQHTESVNAVFAQLATSSDLMAHTVLAAGVRYNSPTVGESATIWTLSGKHDFSGSLFLRGQVGTSFRLPTAEELFANDPFDERGDPNLKPEQSTNANLSLGGLFDSSHFNWEATCFWRNVTNLIDFVSFDQETQQSVFGNVPGTVVVKGAELQLGAEFPDFTASISYTYSSAVQDSGQQINAIPLQQAKATLDYHPLGEPFGITASAVFVGQVWATGLGVGDGIAEYGRYPLVDLAGRFFFDAAQHHILTLRLQNAFDRQYASSLGTGVRDVDGSEYVYWNLGVPRTLQVRYTYKFF